MPHRPDSLPKIPGTATAVRREFDAVVSRATDVPTLRRELAALRKDLRRRLLQRNQGGFFDSGCAALLRCVEDTYAAALKKASLGGTADGSRQ
jgi:hypothetical protein